MLQASAVSDLSGLDTSVASLSKISNVLMIIMFVGFHEDANNPCMHLCDADDNDDDASSMMMLQALA